MKPSKKLSSFEELQQLLPESERVHPVGTSTSRTHDGHGKRVRLRIDTHGRKGKSVTLVEGLQHNPATMEEIARILKQHCGSGGTVKGKVIEIQGDQREKIAEKLGALNYEVSPGK